MKEKESKLKRENKNEKDVNASNEKEEEKMSKEKVSDCFECEPWEEGAKTTTRQDPQSVDFKTDRLNELDRF